jgi:hypothetical protein
VPAASCTEPPRTRERGTVRHALHPERVEPGLGRAGQAPNVIAPKTFVPKTETRDVHRACGRYLTLIGTNPFFHLPQDRCPHEVDTDIVTCVAAAAAALVVTLTR